MDAVNESSTSPLAPFSFPRTGKRGVPQQFPRRLYDMLDSETKALEQAEAICRQIIAWSDSGNAFRIFDIAEFSSTVLPKYFRTTKFSSFQRNLNLYGFTKVRRGVDTDMYAHPSFVRDKPSGLLQLQKITTKSRRRSVSASSGELRSVSPPLSSAERLTQGLISSLLKTSHAAKKIVVHGFTGWDQSNPAQISPGRHYSFAQSESDTSSTGDNDRGKLDLLALALEQQEFATRP